jgi:nitric oxide reductase subunit B
MFLASVGFWNFLGAGIFGFLINLPIVSYYEIGTALTANHAHASISLWSLNLGLAWMVFATLFPLGVIQLYHSVSISMLGRCSSLPVG